MQAELTQEEQELFDTMSKDEAPPPAKAEPKADAKAEEKPDAKVDAPDAKTEKMLPAAAVAEARAENKELRKELASMKDLVAAGDKKLQKFIESAQKQAAPGPKFEDDPAGNLKHENEQLRKNLEEINARLAKQDESSQAGDKMTRFASFVQSKEAAFAKTNPDYFKAAEFVAEVWRDEFREAGYDEANLPQMVFQKSIAITNQATQKEKDPAEAIYKIAKRYGFTTPAKVDDAKVDKKPDGESKLEAIKRGQEAAKSAGGAAGPDDLSFASLAQMDDEQIDKLVKDPDWWSKNIRRSPLH